jgi:hypothetical protein
MKKPRFFLALLFLASLVHGQESSLIPVTINWAPVEGAGGYRLEIQDSQGKPALSQLLREPGLSTELPAGTYRVKIASLNRFGQEDSSTPWMKLTATKIPTPEVVSADPSTVSEDENFVLKVRTNGTDDMTRWELSGVPPDSEVSLAPKAATFLGDGLWKLQFPALVQGDYLLTATGKTGKRGRLDKALRVKEHPPVADLVPLQAREGRPVSFDISGKYLAEDLTLSLTSPGTSPLEVPAQTNADHTRLSVSIPPLDPGTYTLNLISPVNPKLTKEKFLTVVPVTESELHITGIPVNCFKVVVGDKPYSVAESAELTVSPLTVGHSYNVRFLDSRGNILASADTPPIGKRINQLSAPSGTLSFRSTVPATVSVDGHELRFTSGLAACGPLSPGTYLVKYEFQDWGDWRQTVQVQAGETTTIVADQVLVTKLTNLGAREQSNLGLLQLRQDLILPSFVLGGVGLVGTGIVYLVGSNAMTQYNNATSASDISQQRSTVELCTTLFNVGTYLTLAATAGGVALWATKPDEAPVKQELQRIREKISILQGDQGAKP